jgi:hypothetical protein
MEDYEQKYKEALETARKINSGEGVAAPKGWSTLEVIFPELKESEDEKIRKSLLNEFIHLQSKGYKFAGLEGEEIVTWLEKQKHIYETTKDKFYLEGFEEGRLYEKQNEQNPTENVEPKFKVKYADIEYNVLEVKDIAGITYFGIEDEPNHIDYVLPENCKIVNGGYNVKEKGSPYPTKSALFSEQNPAWSEKDDAYIKLIISILNNEHRTGRFLTCCINYFNNNIIPVEQIQDWLKSLKQRMKGEK